MDRYNYIYKNDKADNNGVIHYEGMGGCNIFTQIIPEALEVLKSLKNEKIILDNLNGVDLTLFRGMTYEDAIDAFKKEKEIRDKKYAEEQALWEKSPEGIKAKKIEEEKKDAHEKFVFHSVDEAFLALSKVKPANLASKDTNLKDAIKMCEEVLIILLKSEDLRFTNDQIKEMSNLLKSIGCVRFENAASKFKNDKLKTIGDAMEVKGSIDFPLSAFSQLIDTERDTFTFGFSKLTEGGMEYSWCGRWLTTQKEPNGSEKESS